MVPRMWLGVMVASALGGGAGIITQICPLDGTPVGVPGYVAGEQTGLRLDLRPVGDVLPAPPLARCPRCQFVLGPGRVDDGELARLRTLVKTPQYVAEARGHSNHALQALVLVALGAGDERVAFEWLRASWELEEGEPDAWRRAVERALACFDRVAHAPVAARVDSYSDEGSPLERRRTAQLMQVELLRRLGRFTEARATLDVIGALPEMRRGAYVTLLAAERVLIERAQSAAQPFPEVPKFDPREDSVPFITARGLEGFSVFDAAFTVERADFGAFNGLDHALHLSIRARKPRPLDSGWWWNFTKDGNPQFNWKQWMTAHHQAEAVVSKNQGLAGWKAGDSSRQVELQLAGLESNTERDFETFVLPPWLDAGFRKRPVVELILREGSRPCGTVFLDESGGGIVTMIFDGCGKDHGLTERAFNYHPRGNPPTYMRLNADGAREMRVLGKGRADPEADAFEKRLKNDPVWGRRKR